MALSPTSTDISSVAARSLETPESQSYAYKIVDDIAAELAQIITQKKIEKVTATRETGKKLLKTAFKNKDAKLYAYMIRQVLDICINAYRNGDLAEIQELLELDPVEARFWFQLLEERQFGVLSFLMIITGELEKFAEDLEQDKNTILPFKKDVMRQMLSFDIKCMPPSLKHYLTLPENSHDAGHILDFIHDVHFEYYYTLDLPKEFARFALKLSRFAIDSNQDPKLQNAFLMKFDLNHDELQFFDSC